MKYILDLTSEKENLEKAYNSQKYFILNEYKNFIEKGDIVYIIIDNKITYKSYTNERNEFEILVKYNEIEGLNKKRLEQKLSIKIKENVFEINKEIEEYIQLQEIKNIAKIEIQSSAIQILDSNVMFLKYEIDEYKNEIEKIENKIEGIYRLEERLIRLYKSKKNNENKSNLKYREYIINSDRNDSYELFLLKAILKCIGKEKNILLDDLTNEMYRQYYALYSKSSIRLNKYTVSKIQTLFKKYNKNQISEQDLKQILKKEEIKKIKKYCDIIKIENNELIIINEFEKIYQEKFDLIDEIIYILKGMLREINMDRIFTKEILNNID